MEAYLSCKVKYIVDDPLAWWRTHSWRFPRVARMAIDYLTIPAMSSEAERVFSQTRLLIGLSRHRLIHSTIEHIAMMKNWQ